MARGGRGRSQTWKTFLHNHSTGIGAMDFLIVPTVVSLPKTPSALD
jgi:hypothetical protein